MLKPCDETMTAYDLAKQLAQCLDVHAHISSKVDWDACFQFDPDKGTVFCAMSAVSDIAESEKNDPRTASSYKAVLKMADSAFDSCGDEMPEPVRYAVFCCLHEFGHHCQSIEWSAEALRNQDAIRKNMVDAAKKDAQKAADDGLVPELVYQIFENKYRSIPIEKDADERAAAMIGRLLDIWQER